MIITAGVLSALLVLAVLVPGALAYGAADKPIAQLELSGNCDNPNFFLCQPQNFGLGGIWLWVEIDGGAGATSGTADFAGAGCGHTLGGNGGAGAGSIRGETTWVKSMGVPAGAFAFGTDPTNTYYVFGLGPGEVFAVPVTVGHYSAGHSVPGFTIQAQVAP